MARVNRDCQYCTEYSIVQCIHTNDCMYDAGGTLYPIMEVCEAVKNMILQLTSTNKPWAVQYQPAIDRIIPYINIICSSFCKICIKATPVATLGIIRAQGTAFYLELLKHLIFHVPNYKVKTPTCFT